MFKYRIGQRVKVVEKVEHERWNYDGDMDDLINKVGIVLSVDSHTSSNIQCNTYLITFKDRSRSWYLCECCLGGGFEDALWAGG